ncbi:hypothetical protein BH10CYA1_BH10CYA1_03390 [soil metagenome]
MTLPQGPDDAPHEYLKMRGRHLMKELPEETEMVCFDMGFDHGVCIQGEALGRLKNIALSLNCEEALALPELQSSQSTICDKVDKVCQHEWIALWNGEQPLVMPYKGLQGIMLFTAFDTIDAFLSLQPDPTVFQLIHMPGHELFEILDNNIEYDGIFVNAGSDLELYPFAPAQIHELANGRQPRLERKILSARSIAELNHFLDECGMQSERAHSAEVVNGQPVSHYTGDILPGLEQRTFRFHPVSDNGSSDNWGDGVSAIVCAGKLVDLLRLRLNILDAENSPLSSDMKPFAQTTFLWANELQKLIDVKTGKFPRKSLRTVDGARFIRECPQIGTREFVVSAQAKLQSLLK